MDQDRDLLFNTNDWVEIYRTTDEWEDRLIRATLSNQQIRCRPEYKRGADRQRQIVLFVAPEDEVEALEIVSRIGLAVTTQAYEKERGHEDASADGRRNQSRESTRELPRATPTAYEQVTIAEREGIGKIVHYVGQGYELQVGEEPYYRVEEDRWEEFTDFSAQRQEFAILLRHEYPTLFQWLKQEKLMAEFIRLVEATYRDVPPPRPRRQGRNASSPADRSDATDTTDARTSNLARFSLWVALVAVVGVILQLPWYATLTLSILAAITGFIAKYRIDASNGALKGSPIAFLAVIVACIVIAITWRQYQPSQPEPPDSEPVNLLFPAPDMMRADLESEIVLG